MTEGNHFQKYLFEEEKDGKLSFLDVEISPQEDHFVTTV